MLLILVTVSCELTVAAQRDDQTTPSGFERISERSFPSIFMAWNEDVDHGNSTLAGMARHDLLFVSSDKFGLHRVDRGETLNAASIAKALTMRRNLLRLNAKLVILVEIRYFDAWESYLPPDSSFWRHVKDGARVRSPGEILGTQSSLLLDFSRPELQDGVAKQCRTYVSTGVFDGCLFDWWNSAYSDIPGAEGSDRLNLIRKVRAAVGDKVLLVGNVNGTLPTMTAQFLNGVYMEGFGARFFSDWRQAAANLKWLEAHLRKPAFTALEGWYDCGDCKADPAATRLRGRHEVTLMREITALSLTHSDGYVLYSDPDALPTPDHLHDWYSFWNKSLGVPVGAKRIMAADGSFRRAYSHGCVLFNPPLNNAVTIKFKTPHQSLSTGRTALVHEVPEADGDIFLHQAKCPIGTSCIQQEKNECVIAH